MARKLIAAAPSTTKALPELAPRLSPELGQKVTQAAVANLFERVRALESEIYALRNPRKA